MHRSKYRPNAVQKIILCRASPSRFPSRRAARRGQGGQLTTLNFFHVLIFLWSNISRKQTRQYRKSTTTTSIIPVRYGAVNKWRHESIMDINQIYHSFGQHCHCLSCRRPRDLIFTRTPLGPYSAPPPQTPSWKRLVLTTLLKNRSRATVS